MPESAEEVRNLEWKIVRSAIERHLAFLIDDFGFKLCSNQEPRVVYESAPLRVLVFYGGTPPDFDVRIESTEKTELGQFSLSSVEFELLHSQDWGAVEVVAPPINLEELESILSREATRLKEHCSLVLRGQFGDIGRLQFLNSEFKRRFTMEYQRQNRAKGYLKAVHELMNQIIKEQNWKTEERDN